jgi:MFS family permease
MTLVGGWCILLVIGAQLAWGNQSTYIVSYYYHQGKQVTMEEFYVVQPFIVLIATFFYPIGVFLSGKYGSRPVIVLGGIIPFSLVMVCSYIQSPTLFIALYSFGFGCGKGLMYSSVLHAGWSHLPGRKGLASGAIICGFGFGGFIFGLIMNRLCNPENELPLDYAVKIGLEEKLFPPSVAGRVPAALR